MTSEIPLAEFLLARIAEDETLAREADRVYVHPGAYDPMFGARRDDEIASRYWDQIADPDRVLAECEAKRRIVASYLGSRNALGRQTDPLKRGLMEGMVMAHEDAVKAIALPYADHPDYREEWKP